MIMSQDLRDAAAPEPGSGAAAEPVASGQAAVEGEGRPRASPWIRFALATLALLVALGVALRQAPAGDARQPPASWASLPGWLAPLEANRWLRPGSTLPVLTAIELAPDGGAARAWGTGAQLRSEDGGARWEWVQAPAQRQASPVQDDAPRQAPLNVQNLGQAQQAYAFPAPLQVPPAAVPPSAQQALGERQRARPQRLDALDAVRARYPELRFHATSPVVRDVVLAVGADGVVARSGNGGGSWELVRQGGADLFAVALAEDADVALAAGAGTILRGDASAARWEPVRYRRWPAPWFWLLLAGFAAYAGAAVARRLRRERRGPRREGLLEQGVSDAPVTDPRDDRLAFLPVVLALGRFLRHSGTRPPLAIAVNAHWGMGKSSFMGMLASELRRHGARPVWFNVWHHQHDEVLLAPLLQAITHQAIPGLFTAPGLQFRARLVRERWRRGGWATRMAGIALASVPLYLLWVALRARDMPIEGLVDGVLRDMFAAFHYLTAGPWLGAAAGGGLTDVALAALGAMQQDPLKALTAVVAVALVACWFMLLLYMLRPFPSSPAVLLAGLGTRISLSQAEAQTDFRRRFRQHFAEVARALQPRTMVIFIDDLDRCRPEKAAELLEGVNYLCDAGPCFVILGMAREIVEAQIASAHKALAQEQAALRRAERGPQAPAAGDRGREDELDRLAYARSYLRKLVQLDVALPTMESEHGLRMLLAQAEPAGDASKAEAPPASRASAAWRGATACGAWVHSRAGVLAGIALLLALAWQATATGARIKQEKEATSARLQAEAEQLRAGIDVVRAYEHWLRSRGNDGAGAAAERVRYLARADTVLADLQAIEQALALMESEAEAGNGPKYARIREVRFDRARERVRRLTVDAAFNGEEWGGILRRMQPSGAEAGPQPAAVAAAPAGVAGPAEGSWAPAASAVAALLALLAWAAARREDYVVHPTREYQQALSYWQDRLLHGAERLSPRELKRFLNLSRYAVARLRPESGEAAPALALPESRIVEFSARWMLARGLQDAGALRAAMLQPTPAPPQGWQPPSGPELEIFLRVVSDLPADAPAPTASRVGDESVAPIRVRPGAEPGPQNAGRSPPLAHA